MEEADAFIRDACRHLECSFADEDEIEFSTPQIFEFLVRCIWKIDNSSKQTISSYVYPKVITTRLQLGNAISNYLQKFHIRGDTALHTVLYGNINNLRSAFIELIRKLPADAQEAVSLDQGHQFLESVVKHEKSQPEWVPVYCRGLNRNREWKLPNNTPETFPLCNFNKPIPNSDPRKWISQYINSSHTEKDFNFKLTKPALPPKPIFAKKVDKEEETVEEATEENNENLVLQAEYEQKLAEYKALQEKRSQFEEQNRELENKLSKYKPELIEALDDPEAYVQKLMGKIAELNKQMEEDTQIIENTKQANAQKKLQMREELKNLGTDDEEIRRIQEMEADLEGVDERIESNVMLAEKLRKKLSKIDDDVQSMYVLEQRSKELDAMVRKQEQDMVKMQEERHALRKQEERESEAVNRSFAIIYNILLQHCDHYRGRLAMESFTRIHLYCMEILEMLRENGALKQAVGILQSEIYVEEQKQYDKQFELLHQDYQEISDLNDQLFSEIRLKKPDFQMPTT
ncbi:CCDC22 N-terminal domain-containing protein [Caenorhabditis elegans]|uniref:CCDC22 N-terminal domain-containing protein n=1 Tax=Caenorhabditis elegans TaxID=6239 RepID=Q7JP60_CAEEL|nr:Coiled-coil domain-containing protein 22 homolog [Caenorhabditis elegans]CCD70857.1 Coiled-coil domain-containing protein 22 homolog [Caenorhabditis elegans]|eukprot:NP_001024849.1 Uncharacterized protein CELE_R08E3.3 [Caenorhabditis elegans]